MGYGLEFLGEVWLGMGMGRLLQIIEGGGAGLNYCLIRLRNHLKQAPE